MKRAAAAVVLFFAAVSLTVWSDYAFNKELDTVSASLNEIVEFAEYCSDELLKEKIDALLSQWEHSSVLLHSLILHEGMDQLEQNITALPLLAEYSDRNELQKSCIEAINQIKNLSEAEKLSVENIL